VTYKRLESGRFKLPALGADAQSVALYSPTLAMLLDGKSPYGPALVALALLFLIP
jgi:hypothetical protein